MKTLATCRIAMLLLAPVGALLAAVPAAPTIFAPGVISGADGDACPAFLPDGRTVLFWRDAEKSSSIMLSHRAGGTWSTPVVAPFSGRWRDLVSSPRPHDQHQHHRDGDHHRSGHCGGARPAARAPRRDHHRLLRLARTGHALDRRDE